MTNPLSATYLDAAERVRNLFRITLPQGFTKDDLLDTGFYAHIAARLHKFDKIEVIAADGSWYGELLVIEVPPEESRTKNWAKATYTFYAELGTATKATTPDELKVEWNLGTKSYRVLQTTPKGKTELFSSPNKSEAEKWLANFTAEAA